MFLKKYSSDESDVDLPDYRELMKMTEENESEGDTSSVNRTGTNNITTNKVPSITHTSTTQTTVTAETEADSYTSTQGAHSVVPDVAFIGNNGREEEGKGAGVLREALSTFWNQFFNSLTVGTQEKVPAIRHDYQRGAFLALCLFGEESITSESLLSSFRLYISEDERETLQKCIKGKTDSNDDDVLDLLSNYKCYRTPTKENIAQIVSELAHQEIVQKPRYVMNCWAPIMKPLIALPDLQSFVAIENLYDIKKPTAKKILK
ncbi:hypothetical protein P5673_024547 [Acropora cervicornis]|uniref:Uncharacterized protein n=1 Tax=Acropora cervicornis TaxID=6130 RepID=A0AAD9Q3W6_ACRCE|nr:hypothetical protein P5673_024547 [Acropora cervicornis]